MIWPIFGCHSSHLRHLQAGKTTCPHRQCAFPSQRHPTEHERKGEGQLIHGRPNSHFGHLQGRKTIRSRSFVWTRSHKRPNTMTRVDFCCFFSFVLEHSITSLHFFPFLQGYKKLNPVLEITIHYVGYLWRAWKVETFFFGFSFWFFPTLSKSFVD